MADWQLVEAHEGVASRQLDGALTDRSMLQVHVGGTDFALRLLLDERRLVAPQENVRLHYGESGLVELRRRARVGLVDAALAVVFLSIAVITLVAGLVNGTSPGSLVPPVVILSLMAAAGFVIGAARRRQQDLVVARVREAIASLHAASGSGA